MINLVVLRFRCGRALCTGWQLSPTGQPCGLTAAHIRISMDGRGRALDNIFVERLWRTVK